MSATATATGTAAQAEPSTPSVDVFGVHVELGRRWYASVVQSAFRRGLVKWAARRAEVRDSVEARGEKIHAGTAIRRASLKSAAAGALAGGAVTAAAVLTAETCPWTALAALPVTAGVVGVEALFRSVVHVELACELAETYGVPFDPDDEEDLWSLYALVSGAAGADGREGRDDRRLERVTRQGAEEIGEGLGQRLLGVALLRDVVPFVAVVTSTAGNYLATRRLGHTMRRFMRYRRGVRDALESAKAGWSRYLDLAVEGMWFIFTADGTLTPEEAAELAHMLRDLDPAVRRQVLARFGDDERSWLARVHERVPPECADAFLRLLEVAAALDKRVGLPERKILRRVAEGFGRVWTPDYVERLMAELSERGVAKM